MKLLHKDTFEYGWGHSGVESWGGNWHARARNEALEQIRRTVAKMVNLKELETFVKKDIKGSGGLEGSSGEDSSSVKISASGEKSTEERERWVNQNNYLINVENVRIKPGTDWTKTKKTWDGKRSWKASATMLCDLEIYGKE